MSPINRNLWIAGAIIIACLAVIVAIFVMTRSPRPSTAKPPANPGSAVTASTTPTNMEDRAPHEPKTIVFDRTVAIGEKVAFDIRFRDFSKLPADFKSVADLDGKLPVKLGHATLTLREVGQLDEINPLLKAEQGTFYVANVDFTGDAANPSDRKFRPAGFEEVGVDQLPQLVLMNGDEIIRIDSDLSRRLSRERKISVLSDVRLSNTAVQPLLLVYRWTYLRSPVLAIEFIGKDGAPHYWRVKY